MSDLLNVKAGNSQEHSFLESHRSQTFVPQAGALDIDFLTIYRILRRWIWLILGILLFGTATAAYFVKRITPTYRAVTTLEVRQEEQNIIDISSVDNVIANNEFLQTQIKLLGSETLIRDVVEGLNLISDEALTGDPELTSGLTREKRVRRTIGIFKKKLSVADVDKSRLITVSFEHTNPAQAAKIANTTASTFIKNSLARKYDSTEYARDFLEGRIEAVRANLEAAERELVKYASDVAIVYTGDGGGDGNQSLDRRALVDVDSELTDALIASSEAKSALDSWDGSSLSELVLKSPVINNLKETQSNLQDEYLEKRAKYKDAFPEMVELKARIEAAELQIQSEETKIIATERARLERDLQLAQGREVLLSQKVQELKGKVVTTSVNSINFNILQRQVDSERSQYDALLQRLKEITVSGQLGESLVQVVDVAYPPQHPFKPRRIRLLLLALMLSGAVALTLIYLIEIIDDKIKTPNDVSSKLGLNLLGVIPKVRGAESEVLADIQNPTSALAEAYAALRTNLQFTENTPQIIQITSSRPSEGKSTTALALAASFAALGEDVLLIDCDIRYPTFTGGKTKGKGMTELLISKDAVKDHTIELPGYPNLYLLTSGRKVDNPTEILSRPRFVEVLEEARAMYTVMVIDSPPVLGLADAPIIGAKVDGTLFVTEALRMQTPHITRSIERLRKSGTRIVGGVLNKFNSKSDNYYAYDYYGGYGYGRDTSENKKDSGVFGKLKPEGRSHNKNKIDLMGPQE